MTRKGVPNFPPAEFAVFPPPSRVAVAGAAGRVARAVRAGLLARPSGERSGRRRGRRQRRQGARRPQGSVARFRVGKAVGLKIFYCPLFRAHRQGDPRGRRQKEDQSTGDHGRPFSPHSGGLLGAGFRTTRHDLRRPGALFGRSPHSRRRL